MNTSDPQASSEIRSSKENGFFKGDYALRNDSGHSIRISEAWVESVWLNKIVDSKPTREKTGSVQLVLKIDTFSDQRLAINNYLTNWELRDEHGHTFGTGNGVFINFLDSTTIPDTFHISLCKTTKGMIVSTADQFTLIRNR